MMTKHILSTFTLWLIFNAVPLNGQSLLRGDQARQIIPSAEIIKTNRLSNIPSYIKFKQNRQTSVENTFLLLNKVYKLSEDYGFVLLNEHVDKLGHKHYRFQQTYQQKLIESSMILMHSKNDLVYAINGLAFNNLSLQNSASVTESNALNKAIEYIDAESYKWENSNEEEHLKLETNNPTATYFPEGKLVYIQPKLDQKQLRLAYKFNIYAQKPVSRSEVYVDAITNTVIFENKIIKHIDVPGTATTGYSGVRTITTDSVSSNNYRLRETLRGNGIETYNMNNNNVYGSATDFTDTDNNWNNVNTSLDQYATDAHWGSEMTYDYYDLQHGRNSIDDAGFALKNYIHYNDGANATYNNAFWDGQRMTFGDGNGGSTTPLVSLDISGHEVTHGLTNFTANLIYQDESGALNESFSDIFGTCIENFARPTNWNWTLGEDIGNIIRSVSNPGTYNDPDTYMGNNWVPAGGPDNGGVHSNSGVQNYWFYLLTDGGSGINDNGDSYSVTAQGFTIASQIAFRNLTVYLTPNSTFADARYYAIQSAVDLFGPCSPEVEATTDAWYAVGVGNAYVNYVLADFVANDTLFCSAPNTVNFQNLSLNGTSFVWNFGDGTTASTAVNPSHTYATIGSYDVSLIADGGSCGADTIVLTNFITIDSALPCLITLPVNGIGSTQTACVGTLFDSGGDSGNYGDQEDAQITLAPLGADSVRIDFTMFNIEPGNGPPNCNYDYLDIYDGNSTTAPLIGKFCNNDLPPAFITSSGPALTIVFHSDQALTFSGFQLDWQCYLSMLPPTANFESQDTVSCSGIVAFTDLSVNGPTGWLWDFGDGNSSNLQNPIHTYTSNGTYTVKLVTTNAQGIDSIIFTDYIAVDFLDVPIGPDTSVCENQSVNLNANGIGVTRWYANPTGGTLLQEGNPYTTPNLSANTTYFASDYEAGTSFNAGASSSAIGSGGFFNGDQSLIFNCTEACTLKTVDVVAGSTGNRTIELRNSAGAVLETITVNIPNTPTQYQTVVLDMPIPVGIGLQLGVASGSAPDLFRNNTGANYPYTTANGVISITGSTAQTANTYYYFFYNWEVETPGCESPRTPINVTVHPDFNLAITNAPDYTCSYQTAIPLSTNYPGGMWTADCINCIDPNTGVFQPNQAGIGVWTISYTVTNNCEKTTSVLIPVETCLSIEEEAILSISIFPNPSHQNVKIECDSEIINNIIVSDISGKLVQMISIQNNQTDLNSRDYESGIYFFNFIDNSGNSIAVKKFIKQ
ncbi:MAG: M4 family metallopeptidase [Crocinitomicaceae bacterium]